MEHQRQNTEEINKMVKEQQKDEDDQIAKLASTIKTEEEQYQDTMNAIKQ